MPLVRLVSHCLYFLPKPNRFEAESSLRLNYRVKTKHAVIWKVSLRVSFRRLFPHVVNSLGIESMNDDGPIVAAACGNQARAGVATGLMMRAVG